MRQYIQILYLSLYFAITATGQTVLVTDVNFRTCLKDRYPSVVNTKGELIIANAALLKGSLSCYRRNISDIEEIKYFTALTDIDISDNQIKILPNLSSISNLVHLEINNNDLSYLSDLSKLNKLKRIFAQNNKIQVIPDLSKNDSLTHLNIHSNKLDTLPDLSVLKQLAYLNFVNNRITSIPNLDKITSLVTLIAYANKIDFLPPLTNLNELRYIDLSQNQLTAAPVFADKNKVQTLILDRNQIRTLPDYSKSDSIKNVRLNGNNLTFKELLKLSAKLGYDTLFKIYPQKTFEVGKALSVTEFDSVTLSTGIDSNTSGISYDWYKNGLLVATVTADKFLISKAQLSDTGKYTCRIRHSLFNGFFIQTNEFALAVKPCLDLLNLATATTEINCIKTGTVAVNDNRFPAGVSYKLISNTSGKTYYSGTGIFTGLSETSYRLILQTKKGCTKIYDKEIKIQRQACQDFLVTPDNDGNMDTFYFAATGKAEIYDKRGNKIKTIFIPGDWDCTSDKGKVSTGYYIADVNNGESQIGLSVVY